MFKTTSTLVVVTQLAFIAACTSPASEPTTSPSIDVLITESSIGLAGDFIVIDARRASDVASPLNPELELPLGETVTFSEDGHKGAGLGCDDWQFKRAEYAAVPVQEDPVLSDLAAGLNLAEKSSAGVEDDQAYTVTCQEKVLTEIQIIDDRVFLATWSNSTINLILERPLSQKEVEDLQTRLKAQNYYQGEVSGVLDVETQAAFRRYLSQRAEPNAFTPTPARPAITNAVLDELGVRRDR